ncbi:MAG TPA: hypothetical protein VK524_03550 [Polyangiaceae bacterium]|nr:hypothetical protein [Polyangiaceae bacterium]
MHQATRVQERQASRDVTQVRARFAELYGRGVSEILPFYELHRVVRTARVFAVVEDANDARMLQARKHLVLAFERFDEQWLGFRNNSLQRQLAASQRVEHAVHHAHPTGTELFQLGVARGRDKRRRLLAARHLRVGACTRAHYCRDGHGQAGLRASRDFPLEQ